ncbi:MAG: CDP-glycerol glycerophosphotransferase family protein [Patescibacteria group bacterium]
MRTIFITIFEGIESKNILRTDILSTLLKQDGVRIVLLTKNQERIRYHQQEFNDPRILYEVVPVIAVKGLDAVFRKLKFLLLRTETMAMRRRTRYREQGGFVSYLGGSLFNFIFARPPIRRVVRALDYLLVKNNTFSELFDRYHPDIVVMAGLFDEQELHLLRETRHQGVYAVGFINSWDRVTARCILRLLPDSFVVFNRRTKEEIKEHDEANENNIFVGGIPQYDRYVHITPLPRDHFFKKLGISANTKLLVYSPIGSSYGRADWDIIDLLYQLNGQEQFGKNIAILVRFPPNDFVSQDEIRKRPHLLYDHPGVRFSASRGVDWDMTTQELEYLTNTLHHMSLLVCYASSISVDAAMLDRPVINLIFQVKDNISEIKSVKDFYPMAHYRSVLESGGVRLVGSEEELITWVKTYLADPARDHEGRMRLAKEQCEFLDGKSGERIGRFILEKLATSAQ